MVQLVELERQGLRWVEMGNNKCRDLLAGVGEQGYGTGLEAS